MTDPTAVKWCVPVGARYWPIGKSHVWYALQSVQRTCVFEGEDMVSMHGGECLYMMGLRSGCLKNTQDEIIFKLEELLFFAVPHEVNAPFPQQIYWIAVPADEIEELPK